MTAERAHEVTADDGVVIRAKVEGQGPPLVLLHGVLGDAGLDWRALVPHLADRFTCHLLDMRGRGRSDEHPNVRIDRICEDYAAYVESIGEPTGLVGWSSGAGHALAVSARSEAVLATASYEPVAGMLMDEQERSDLIAALSRGRELVERGELPGAVRAVAAWPFTAEDLSACDDLGYFEAAGSYAPHILQVFQQVAEYRGAMPEDPEVLGAIGAAVLVLHGSETSPFFEMSAQHVVDHVPEGRGATISGAGHAGPVTHSRTVAEELVRFFGAAFS